MAHSILAFDFGTNEEAAQQARHKIEGWKQGFRLGKKLLLKFDRKESDKPEEQPSGAKQSSKKKAIKSAQEMTENTGGIEDSNSDAETTSNIRLLVRLDFSEHEKLSHQQWLTRIPSEEPFRSAKNEAFRQGDPAFAKAAERFDLLE